MKKIQKLIIIFCAISLVMTVLTACSNTKIKTTNSQDNMDTFIDCVGRKVEIPKNIKKVAAYDSFTGEVMVMIGAGENMVACTQGVKSNQLLQEIYPKLSEVSAIGYIDEAEVRELNPDVLLVENSLYELEGESALLDNLGIPYLVIEYTNMEEQIEALHLIGEVVGGNALEKAEKICNYYQDTIDLVKGIAQNIPQENRRSIYHSINQTFATDGINSLGTDWINTVGCTNVSANQNLTYAGSNYITNQEQFLASNPNVIICNSDLTIDYFKNEEVFQSISAVNKNQIYKIPVGATRWGDDGSVEIFFGMLWLGITVYPDYYSQIDLKSEVMKFYKEVLGITIDDDTYNKILSGEGI